jgi:hypothetical protein
MSKSKITPKYEILHDDVRHGLNERTYCRIRALRDFGPVRKGDLGGYIQYESNLSHDGLAWVADKACVANCAHVYEDAWVGGYAQVSGSAHVRGRAIVAGHALVVSSVTIKDDARVFDHGYVFCYASVGGTAQIGGDAEIGGEARIDSGCWTSGYHGYRYTSPVQKARSPLIPHP